MSYAGVSSLNHNVETYASKGFSLRESLATVTAPFYEVYRKNTTGTLVGMAICGALSLYFAKRVIEANVQGCLKKVAIYKRSFFIGRFFKIVQGMSLSPSVVECMKRVQIVLALLELKKRLFQAHYEPIKKEVDLYFDELLPEADREILALFLTKNFPGERSSRIELLRFINQNLEFLRERFPHRLLGLSIDSEHGIQITVTADRLEYHNLLV